MVGELVGQERWQVHGAGAGGGLGRAELEPATQFVQGAVVGVDLDTRVRVVEVGAGPLQSGEFAPAHAGVGGGEHHQPGGGGPARGEDDDLVGGGVRAFGPFGEADAEFAAGVGADEAFVDGFAEDHGEQHENVLAALVGQAAAELVVDPALDRDPLNVAQCGA